MPYSHPYQPYANPNLHSISTHTILQALEWVPQHLTEALCLRKDQYASVIIQSVPPRRRALFTVVWTTSGGPFEVLSCGSCRDR